MFFKKISKLFLIFICFANFSFAKDFIVLEDGFDSKNSLIELFSYKCIHCYNHHKFGTLNKLKKELPNLSYNLYPISLADKNFGKELNELFAFAQAKDMQENKDASSEDGFVHRLADYLFVLHFVKKQEIQNLNEIEQIALNVLNVSKNELENFLQSNEAKKILANYEKANEFAQIYGTPTFIVNGKYQIKPEALSSMQNLLKIVSELSKNE